MKLIPMGTKIVIEMIKDESVIHLPEGVKKNPVRCIVDGIGENVSINLKVGDEVRILSLTHVETHNDHINLGLVDQSDIWAVIKRDE